jgi:hypothetical protein
MSVFVDLQFMSRTMRIRYGDNVGAGVYVEIEGVCLLLTASHLMSGLQPGDSIGVRHRDDWVLLAIEQWSGCAVGSDVCALRPRTRWGEGLREDQLSADLIVGEDVVYCGFPLGMEMDSIPDSNGYPAPLVKRAIFSGALSRGEYREYLFDTVNNRGFSGGPIIKRDRTDGKLRVAAIVSGYKFDAPSSIFRKEPDGTSKEVADHYVRPNSGFMIGTPMHLALEAAKALI